MNSRLSLAKQLECSFSANLHCVGKRCKVNDLQNRREMPVRRITMFGMFVGRCGGNVRMRVPLVRMPVIMAVLVVVMRVVMMRVLHRFCRPVGRYDINLRACDAAAHHLAHLEARTHVQGLSCFRHGLKRNARIDKRPEQHIAANARKTLQISNTHCVVILNGERWTLLTFNVEGPRTRSCAAAGQHIQRKNRIQ